MEKKTHIGREIRNLSNRIKRDLDEGHDDNLTMTQRWILGYLMHNRGKEVFQKDIEKEFDIRRSTATGILQVLERDGYLLRESVASDGRLKKLVLTEKAFEHHARCISQIEALEKRLEQGLSEDEIQMFIDLCRKISANLDKQGGNF